MYAVVKTGGKQYRVEAGATLVVEKLDGEPGSAVTFDRVLLVGDGEQVTVGRPTVPGASVSATVLGAQLGQKIIVFKFKPKVKYRRRTGHRQRLTLVRIDAISADGKRVTAPTAEEAEASEAGPAAKSANRTASTKSDRAAKAAKPAAGATGLEAATTYETAAAEATAAPKRRPPRAKAAAEAPSGEPAAAKPRARRATTAGTADSTPSASKPTTRGSRPKAGGPDKTHGSEPAGDKE